MNHQSQRIIRKRRSGIALLLVLFAVTVSATLAISFLSAQNTTLGIARNLQNHSRARYVAESGLALTLAYVRANSDWRTVRSNGTWATDVSYGAGTFTVIGEDGRDTNNDDVIGIPAEGDGDLSDDSTDLLTITVMGKVSGTSHVVRAVVTPAGEAGPIGHWKLDETSGTTASDASGNGHNGTLNNMSPASDWVTGTISGALDFDGSNDYVQIPHSIDLNGSSGLTYTAWIYTHSWSGNNRQVMAKSVHGGGSGRAQMGIFSEAGKLKGRAETTDGRINVLATLPTLNTWTHVALVFDGVSLKLYVDGVESAAATFSTTTLKQTTDPLNIGKRVGSSQYYFDGLIDDVRVYKLALSELSVIALSNGGGGSLTLRPAGVGTQTALTGTGSGAGNWDRVNEETSDVNITYVASANSPSYQTDIYATQDSGVSSGTISSVTIHVQVRKGSAGSKVKTVLRTGGTEYLGAKIILNSTTYGDYSTSYSTNPSTSAAWTWTEIDAMEIGVSSRKAARCTQLYAVVEYSSISGGSSSTSGYAVQWAE